MTPATRVVGVDVARCLALLGMMATHILPSVVDGEVPLLQALASGRASALFAVLAGVSLVLAAGTTGPVRGRALGGLVVGTVVRAVWIALVGLLLGGMESGIAVILVYYAVLFVLTVPFLALRTPALVGVAVGWAALGPLASHLLRAHVPPTSYVVPSFDQLGEAPGSMLRELLLTGYYPVLTWAPYVLLGLAVGRMDLRSWRTSAVLVWAGGVAVVAAALASDALLALPGVRRDLILTFTGAGWRGDLDTTLASGLYGVTPTGSDWWLAVRAPHTGTSFDLLMTAGSALLVLAVCLVVGRWAPRACSVLFGAGAMTLSLYTLHVALRSEGAWDGDTTATLLGQALLVLVIGAVFGWGRARGPLEVLVGETSRGARRWVTRRR